MANELLAFSTILRESMSIFENACVAAKTVNRRYESKIGDFGETFYVPIPETPIVSDGPTLDLKDTAPTKVAVTLDKQKHTDFTFTSKERSLNIDQFSDMFLRPRMEALANQVDVDILNLTQKVSMSVGTAGTGPTSALIPMQASQKLTEHGVPQGDRSLILSPQGKVRLLGTASTGIINLSNPGIPAGDAYKNASMGMIAGAMGLESNNTYSHTVGSDVTMGNWSSEATEGQTTITAAAAGTLAVGDVFTVGTVGNAGAVYDVNPITKATLPNLKQFVVTAASSANAQITFSPPMYAAPGPNKNVSNLPSGTNAVTFVGTASTVYGQDVMYHRDAFGLVCADLVMPEGVDVGARRMHKGISMRLVRDYDIVNDRFPCRIDILYGVVAYRPHTHACRITN
jgi:hypothetical protein